MKNRILLIAISVFPLIGFSQIEVNTELLDENNVGITLSDGGVFLAQNYVGPYGVPTYHMDLPGCEFPKGSGNNLINGLSMWFGGVNEFDEPRISAPNRMAYEDQFSGALNAGAQNINVFGDGSINLFSISREEIDYHVTNYQNPNYIPSPMIAMWPAHGDVSLGFEFYQAPFVDANGDGYYDPSNGDYPCIQGDRAVYITMNDLEGSYHCGSPQNAEGLGIEMHYLFYQYSSIPELANTTFCKVRVVNRSGSNYTDFSSSIFMNPDIGYSSDDFVGTDIERNMIYGYNGEESDYTYGYQPPAVGVVSLNHSLSRSRVFKHEENYGYHFPEYPPEVWQVLQGNLLNGETHPDRFAYSEDSHAGGEDIQTTHQGDKKMLYTIDIGDFAMGEEHQFDFAIVVGQDKNHMESVQHLKESVDFVQGFYNEDKGICYQGAHGIAAVIDPPQEPLLGATTIYPNPSNGSFTVEVEEDWVGANLTIFNPHGRVLQSKKHVTEFQNNVTLANSPGIYLVTLEKDGNSKIFKAVVE